MDTDAQRQILIIFIPVLELRDNCNIYTIFPSYDLLLTFKFLCDNIHKQPKYLNTKKVTPSLKPGKGTFPT